MIPVSPSSALLPSLMASSAASVSLSMQQTPHPIMLLPPWLPPQPWRCGAAAVNQLLPSSSTNIMITPQMAEENPRRQPPLAPPPSDAR